jgi:hypothetical protein
MQNVKRTRWSLEAAIAISPLVLFLSADLLESAFINDQMYRLCSTLGATRPAELFEAERKWWLSLLDLANTPSEFDRLDQWLKERRVDDRRGKTTFFTGLRARLDASAAIVDLWQIATRQDLVLGHKPVLVSDLLDLSHAGTTPPCSSVSCSPSCRPVHSSYSPGQTHELG